MLLAEVDFAEGVIGWIETRHTSALRG